MSATTTSLVPSSTSTSTSNNNSNGPTNSPLLFFVALGFGVVFTNLWIIVGVKYCFRYNQRNRLARALNGDGEPIDMGPMQRPHRRRREKKLMTMEEVNERFPLTKYKIYRATREANGLPAAGGVTAPPSRAASLKDAEGTITTPDAKTHPPTTLDLAQQDHAEAIAGTSSEIHAKQPIAHSTTADTLTSVESAPSKAIITIQPPLEQSTTNDDEDESDSDDPIRTAAPTLDPLSTAPPGDTCAICIDNLDDDDDVRGLTCGHAFHAACVDPWLTARRACCPLCKADYHVPKVRNLGEGSGEGFGADGSGRGSGTGMGMGMFGPRVNLLAVAGARRQRVVVRSVSRSEALSAGIERARSMSVSGANGGSEIMGARSGRGLRVGGVDVEREEGGNGGGWRNRLPSLPAVSMPGGGFWRRGRQQDDVQQSGNEDLEAGRGQGEGSSRLGRLGRWR